MAYCLSDDAQTRLQIVAVQDIAMRFLFRSVPIQKFASDAGLRAVQVTAVSCRPEKIAIRLIQKLQSSGRGTIPTAESTF